MRRKLEAAAGEVTRTMAMRERHQKGHPSCGIHRRPEQERPDFHASDACDFAGFSAGYGDRYDAAQPVTEAIKSALNNTQDKLEEDSSTDSFNVTPLLRKSAAEGVVSQIIDMIRSGNLKARDRLPTETELARAFRVSRPVVREALRGLAILGVVETRQGGRCFVTDLTVARLMAPLQFVISLDEASVDSVHDARLLVEAGMIRKAVGRISDKDFAKLDEMVEAGFELSDDPLGFRMLDQEFHRTLNRLSGNPFLEVVAQSFYELGMEYRRIATETPGLIDRSAVEHRAIIEALKLGDPDAAEAAMSAHLKSIHETTAEAIRRSLGKGRKRPWTK
jgi:GntR family transcriptional regulator, transcriptional repressor for pyruvate dehydrogenase complex